MKFLEIIKKPFIAFSNGVKNFRKNTKGMNFSQFVGYIKDYYLKDAIFFGGILAVIIGILVSSYLNRHTDYIVFGVGVNVDLSTEGTLYIKDEFFERYKTEGRQKVDFTCVTIDNFETTNDADASYYSAQSVVAQVSAQRLDYMIMDEVGFQYFASQEIYMDLNDILTPEEMEEWKDRIVFVQDEEKEDMMAAGINITQTEFIKKNNPKGGDVFLAFAVNAPNRDMAYEFFHYILEYKD